MRTITDVKPSGKVTSFKPTNLSVVLDKLHIYATGDIYLKPQKRTLYAGMPMGLLLALTYPTEQIINVYS